MSTCVHTCLHVYMHVYMCTCMSTCVHTCLHVCMHVYMCACMSTCVHTCLHMVLHALCIMCCDKGSQIYCNMYICFHCRVTTHSNSSWSQITSQPMYWSSTNKTPRSFTLQMQNWLALAGGQESTLETDDISHSQFNRVPLHHCQQMTPLLLGCSS